MSTPPTHPRSGALEDRAARFVEAALVYDQAHREGGTELADALLDEEPGLASADIFCAAMSGEIEAVRGFLADDESAARREGGPRDWPPLLYLCFSRYLRSDPRRAANMVEAAQLLLSAGADPNASWVDPREAEDNRETCVYGAAGVANNVDLTGLLLDAGADPNDGETPYHAVEHEGVPCVELLWEHFDEDSRSIAIQHQVDYPDPSGLRRLLRLGADPNSQRFFDRSPLHGAVFRDHQTEIFDILFEFGAEVDVRDKSGRTPYAMAARAGNERIMKVLRDRGATTELAAVDGFLAACAIGDRGEVAARLAADPELLDGLSELDRAVICEAAAAGNAIGVRTMIEAGFDVDTRGTVWKAAAIHRAAMCGHRETVELLYEHGADLTIRDAAYDSSPLGWAEHGGNADIVDYLQRDAARLDLRDAVHFGKEERVFELLGDAHPDEVTGGAEPGALLRAAAHAGHRELVVGLLERGADPAVKSSEGLSAADHAARQGHEEIAALLR